jgi:glycosyltransferase involved in cell wall biosynthesis
MEQQFRKIAAERKLGDVIKITGRISSEKMPEVYQNNDIFISASMQEGMSNAMLEAMASGLPIVTTRCEGLAELIDGNGLIVEQDNIEAIVKAIKRLADNSDLYEQMSVAARKQAEKFNWANVAESYIEQYRKIIT